MASPPGLLQSLRGVPVDTLPPPPPLPSTGEGVASACSSKVFVGHLGSLVSLALQNRFMELPYLEFCVLPSHFQFLDYSFECLLTNPEHNETRTWEGKPL